MESEKIEKKLDSLSEILRNLFILEASKMGIKKKDVRKILGVNTDEITKVWKYLKNDN